MILHINTSNTDKIIIKLNNKKFTADSKKRKAQYLLEFLNKTLEKQNKKFEDITEIKVHTGPGSFTGIRVGVSVAQALGFTLNIPVNGKNISKNEKIEIKYE